MLDATPVVLLAATVAWVSLVTMEFYEKLYRPKIDANLNKLKDVGENQLKELLKEIEIKIRKGHSDINVLENKAGLIVSLLNADKQLIAERKTIFFALFVSSILSIGASYAPELQILNSLTVAMVAYIASGIVFVWGFWILKKIFWFDRQFLLIAKAERDSPTSPDSYKGSLKSEHKKDYSHLIAVYFDEDSGRLNPVGDRAIVNSKTKTAYYMGDFVDFFVLQHDIRWERHVDTSLKDWCTQNRLLLVPHAPAEEDLE